MANKRKPTPHQKQIRFFMFFFGTIMIALAIGVIWLINHRSMAH